MKTNPHADPSTKKRLAYNAAAAMLARQDGDSVRYAALELAGAIRLVVSTEIANTTGQSLYETSGWKRDTVFAFTG
jgi:hypothetical protein